MEQKNYDCIIIGGGPAGITAGIYCTRAGLSTLLLESTVVGGQSAFTSEIDNYPGFKKIEGFTLSENFLGHAEELGVNIKYEEVTGVRLDKKEKVVATSSGEYRAKALILATGARARLLGVQNEEKFTGRGISYCATCDGAFFAGKKVVVVGGGNSAFEEALFLANNASSVTLLHILDEFQAVDSLVKKLESHPKITYHLNSRVKEVIGDKRLSKIKALIDGEEVTLDADGLFIAIGRIPNTDIFKGLVGLDRDGYVVAGEDTYTGVPGVFVAGDIRQKSLRQIITACSDGAVASNEVQKYLIKL